MRVFLEILKIEISPGLEEKPPFEQNVIRIC